MAADKINHMAKLVLDGKITLGMVVNRYGFDTAEQVHNATNTQPWRNWSKQWVRRVR